MITIDQSKFEHYVSSATNALPTIFEMLGDSIDLATAWLQHNILGSEQDVNKLDEGLSIEAERFICLYAFYMAMPSLDLILTDNGFGIVNNENVSPASADRVDKLRRQVLRLADGTIDRMIDRLCGNSSWQDSSVARILVSSVFYKADFLSIYADVPEASRVDLANCKSSILAGEDRVVRRISRPLFKHLLECIRHGRINPTECELLDFIRRSVGFHVSKDMESEDMVLDEIENFLEDNIDAFPLYASGNEYKVKHYEHFQNAKDDSTYFF